MLKIYQNTDNNNNDQPFGIVMALHKCVYWFELFLRWAKLLIVLLYALQFKAIILKHLSASASA